MEPNAIREQIERILHCQSFAGKGQLRKLLGVLARNMDSQSDLSPELVIKELWPDEIRTKRPTHVATEMNRLRHALESYYEWEGKTDPIKIRLPNRSAVAADGTHEKLWIVAEPRGCSSERAAAIDHQPVAQVLPRRRPKKIAMIASLAVALGMAVYVSIRVLAVPDQPKFGRLEGASLVILNADGRELWRKTFPEELEPARFYGQNMASRIWLGDLEGKGRTSVLFAYSPATSESRSSTLICYSDRGEEKWRWTAGKELPEFQGSSSAFKIAALGVLRATENRPRRIVVSSGLFPWWPNQVALLDSNGKTISEYWHSGVLSAMVLADLDGKGREDIIATGVANGYDHQATLVVLDPDRVFGASTEMRPEFQIQGKGVAQEKLRLLFPRSDLNKALFQLNVATGPTIEHGGLRVNVLECLSPEGCAIWYEFDKHFHVVAAYAGSDDFRSAHNRFFQTSRNAHSLTAQEEAAFQRVRCLVGCPSEFVPVGNPDPESIHN